MSPVSTAESEVLITQRIITAAGHEQAHGLNGSLLIGSAFIIHGLVHGVLVYWRITPKDERLSEK